MEDPYSAENIDRLGVLMFQTSDNSQLLRRVLWINVELTIVWSLKNKNTQPSYTFNRENPQSSEPQNGQRRGLNFIALKSGIETFSRNKKKPMFPRRFVQSCQFGFLSMSFKFFLSRLILPKGHIKSQFFFQLKIRNIIKQPTEVS